MPVGERLRAIRLLRRRTLKEIADAAGVSESFVSQLERGRTNGSVASLQRIATALGIEVSDLFASHTLPQPRVLRREAREPIVWGHLGRKSLLTPKPFHSLEVIAAQFDPGGSTGEEPYTHGDSEELLLVIEGRVHVQLDTEVHELRAVIYSERAGTQVSSMARNILNHAALASEQGKRDMAGNPAT